MSEKNKYYVGVCYPENMIEDWETKIGDLIQLPFAYCLHHLDKDSKSEHRKDHVHLLVAWPNTTTERWAKQVMNKLSAPGKVCCPGVQAVIWIRNQYDYLIHDTEACRKAGKEKYDPADRITGNGFDIGLYEQVSQKDKEEAFRELSNLILRSCITNYADFFQIVLEGSEYQEQKYLEAARCYSGHFERLCKGCFLKYVQGKDTKE